MSEDDVANYKIGYRRPPVATRFRRGASGNPKGRPRGVRNLKLAVQQVFTSTVGVRQGEKIRQTPRLEALALKLMERALKGDNRAAEAAIKWAIQLGLLRESDPKPVWDLSDLTDTELRTLEQLVQKTKWNG